MEFLTVKTESRLTSIFLVAVVYVLAFFAGVIVYGLFSQPIFAMFFADLAATVVVWFAGIVFHNSSLYDPYWSVAPILIVLIWFLQKESTLSLFDTLLLLTVLIWGFRLTFNWASGWMGLHHQDWRYTMYREKMPKLWFWTNLLGIHIMPTVLVFLALLPAYYMLYCVQSISILTLIGFSLCLASVLIQGLADRQMRIFKSRESALCIDEGLWRYTRHPNYLGEIGFWWGIFCMQQGTSGKTFTLVGALFITLLFVLISIPMMEAHILSSHPDYAKYKQKVSMLIPWPRRNQA